MLRSFPRPYKHWVLDDKCKKSIIFTVFLNDRNKK